MECGIYASACRRITRPTVRNVIAQLTRSRILDDPVDGELVLLHEEALRMTGDTMRMVLQAKHRIRRSVRGES
jgi:hypothetical protein